MVQKEKKVKLSGITVENELIFDSLISNICLKADKKLSVWVDLKISRQQRILFKLFFEAQFKYFPLIWSFVLDPSITKLANFTKEL